MLSFGLAISFIFLILVLKYLSKKNASPILGMYSQPNKFFYLKFAFMFFILLGKRLLHKYMRRRVVRKGKSHDGTIQVYEADAALEKTQDLGLMPKAVDAVYFNASSKDGGVLIAAVARRPGRICNAFLYLKVDGGELLLSPELPGTTLEQTEEEDGSYRVGGIKIYNKIPMRAWNIKYSGEMKSRDNPDVRREVTLSVTWSTKWSHFNFNTDMAPHGMARDMAREVWSREYFQLLKEFHQNHYEQMGEINGVVTIDGVEHKISMPCIRDHSFGQHRDWKKFHRYALHFIYLENGDCIAVGNVCKPMCFSSLTIGYICLNNLEHRVRPIRAVTCSDFELYNHGEKGTPPTDYGFTFHAGGKRYAVSVVVTDSDKFYIGKQKEALIYERWARYEVNGIKGWGCTEWHYRNLE